MKQLITDLLPAGFDWRERIFYFETIDSTNTQAKAMAAEGATHGTVLIAAHQSAGRGRMGRSFQSPSGMGIYLSVILRYGCAPEQLMHLTCAAGVAMCDAIEAAAGFRPGIKWTNDLVHNSRKLGGILTELITTEQGLAAIVGIGINCRQLPGDFPEYIRSFAGSLSMVTGKDIPPERVAAAMVQALWNMDAQLLADKEAILNRYRQYCITVGRDISLVRGDEVRHGHAIGIDDAGALIVRFADGHSERVNSGEVSIRGMYGYI